MDELNKDPNRNNDKKPLWSKASKGFKKIVDKDGFYIILFICICIVATTAVWVSKSNIDKTREYGLNEYPDIPPDIEDIEEVAIDKGPDVKLVEIDEDFKLKDTKDNGAAASEEQKIKSIPASASPAQQKKQIEQSEQKTMMLPLMGKISLDYAEDKLVYSKTLDQWTTHKGIDIAAKEGSVVKAALDGVVSQIKKDDTMGIIITIDHGNGLQTKYGNLSTDEMVKIGQEVRKGDAISGVGKGTGFEMVEGPHLHFEVIQDGKNIDPKAFLPKFK